MQPQTPPQPQPRRRFFATQPAAVQLEPSRTVEMELVLRRVEQQSAQAASEQTA